MMRYFRHLFMILTIFAGFGFGVNAAKADVPNLFGIILQCLEEGRNADWDEQPDHACQDCCEEKIDPAEQPSIDLCQDTCFAVLNVNSPDRKLFGKCKERSITLDRNPLPNTPLKKIYSISECEACCNQAGNANEGENPHTKQYCTENCYQVCEAEGKKRGSHACNQCCDSASPETRQKCKDIACKPKECREHGFENGGNVACEQCCNAIQDERIKGDCLEKGCGHFDCWEAGKPPNGGPADCLSCCLLKFQNDDDADIESLEACFENFCSPLLPNENLVGH